MRAEKKRWVRDFHPPYFGKFLIHFRSGLITLRFWKPALILKSVYSCLDKCPHSSCLSGLCSWSKGPFSWLSLYTTDLRVYSEWLVCALSRFFSKSTFGGSKSRECWGLGCWRKQRKRKEKKPKSKSNYFPSCYISFYNACASLLVSVSYICLLLIPPAYNRVWDNKMHVWGIREGIV